MTKSVLLSILLILFFIDQLSSLLLLQKCKGSFDTKIHFKKKNGESDADNDKPVDSSSSLWQGIKKFLPNISKAKLEETYSEPVPGLFLLPLIIPIYNYSYFNKPIILLLNFRNGIHKIF
jgi:hypothetical protein